MTAFNSDVNKQTVSLTVNGREFSCKVSQRKLLVDFLREDLSLTGTHAGCEHGVCGACTVLLDGQTARSCLMLAVQADGLNIETGVDLEKLCTAGQFITEYLERPTRSKVALALMNKTKRVNNH